MDRSIVFMGTPEFAVPSLRALIDAGYTVKAVYTQPDRPVGRGQRLTAPAVKQLAVERGIPVHQPERLRGDAEALRTLHAIAPDLIVVVAYGQILPPEILGLPPFGCVNVHASLLPHYRGAAPIQWAILNGDTHTGVTTMLMERGLDTGPILKMEDIPILLDDTAETLSRRLSEHGARLLVETLDEWFAGRITPTPQPEPATYAPMLRKDMATIDWARSARQIFDQIRGLKPWPGTTAMLEGQVIKITGARPVEGKGDPGRILSLGPEGWLVGTADGALLVTEVQLPGKKPQPAAEAARGWRSLGEGQRFEMPAATHG